MNESSTESRESNELRCFVARDFFALSRNFALRSKMESDPWRSFYGGYGRQPPEGVARLLRTALFREIGGQRSRYAKRKRYFVVD